MFSRFKKKGSSQSSSEEDPYECDLGSFVHHFKFARTEAEPLTLEDCIMGKDAELSYGGETLAGGSPLGGSCDLGDFLSELETLDFGSFKPRRPSRLSMVLVNDPLDEQPLSKFASKPKPQKRTPEDEAKLESAKRKLNGANLKKITTNIYIESATNPQTVQLTSLSTPELIIEGLIETRKISDGVAWAVIEVHETFGVSRALRPWEPIIDIIEHWEPDSPNALVIKPRQGELLTPQVSRGSPVMAGWLQVEIRKGRWERRFAVLKFATLYLAKSESLGGAVALCTLQNHDVFSTTRPRPKAPKRPLFALKSQQSIMIFEKPDEDYIHFFACESEGVRDDWVLALRHSRSWAQYSAYLSRPTPFSPFSDPALVAENVAGIQIDSGQFADLEGAKANGGSILTKNTAGGIAGRLFRLVLTGDQGKTDIDRVVGSKALPDVFAEGSLLSRPARVKEEPEATAAPPVEEVFKEGSLLSRTPTRGPVRKDSSQAAMELQANSPLSALKLSGTKPQPPVPLTKAGPLLQLQSKDTKFQGGTLLSSTQPHPINPRTQSSHQATPLRRNDSSASFKYNGLPISKSASLHNGQRPRRNLTVPPIGAGYQPSLANIKGANNGGDEGTPPHPCKAGYPLIPPASPGGLMQLAGATDPNGLFSQGSLLSKVTRRDAIPTKPSGPLLQFPNSATQPPRPRVKRQASNPLVAFK
ncbi:hypothetical protein L0F63_001890 [Massospora cicadina]|nr:hypothetical protein L0F63_001890 [Massospora cicadina]